MKHHSRELFLIQTELIDMKVNMAVSQTIERVIDQITDLKGEMHREIHDLKDVMNARFSSLESRMGPVETKLGIVSNKRQQISNRFMDYLFKAGWLVTGWIVLIMLAYFLQLHLPHLSL